MQIRNAIHPDHMKKLDTELIRSNFLVDPLFESNKINMVYSHIDRIIVGGATPLSTPLELVASKELGVAYFLERREIGIINVGGKGTVTVDGKKYEFGKNECIYIGMGANKVSFESQNPGSPAKFYFNSTPAHVTYPTTRVGLSDAKQVNLGSDDKSNKRTIYQLVHPAVLKSCQLVMGLTMLHPNNTWNTMPCHTHDRRMEVYFYFDVSADSLVFHFMGEQSQTRHIVVRNEQAVICPSWSIHSGVGTSNYSFIWGMAGENQTFTDMDDVPMSKLM
jgi:4-deoxy-L-threo-5-hexosulose-uronate ketol-isomerase